jgi:hypothetical protein
LAQTPHILVTLRGSDGEYHQLTHDIEDGESLINEPALLTKADFPMTKDNELLFF